jgi:flagellin
MSGITLSSGVRQNLLSLQNTASLLTTTQNHLATGKKVNSAFDNPTSYFTSQSLNNRANSLNALLDQIGQATQTLQTANQGLTSITSLLQQALSTAQQALQAPAPSTLSYGAITTNETNLTGSTRGSVAGAIALGTTLGANADTLSIVAGASTYSVTLAATDTIANVLTAINGTAGLGASGAVTASTNGAGKLVLTANSTAVSFTASDNNAEAGFTTPATGTSSNVAAVGSSTDLLQILTAGGITSGDALTFSVSGGATQQVQFGTGTGQVQTLAQLQSALQGLSGVSSASASGSAVSINVASSSALNSLATGAAGSSGATEILNELGLTAGTVSGTAVASGNNTTRTTLQGDFNSILTQIDQLAQDTSYNGVNLLNGDNLRVVFNETNTSSLTISGVTDSSAGLGLTQISGTGFQADSTINTTISSIQAALSNVQAQTETFGTNASTIQIRQSFTQQLVNVLQTGANNLVLADQNQESANLLTLQTQQQLEISALSIANQANQSVLKLFG